MKLTNKDKNYLSSIGYHNDDFDVIERNSKSIKYELMSRQNKDISIKLNQKQAISLLGRETFLSGIGRATFHDSAVRTTESNPNLSVYFY